MISYAFSVGGFPVASGRPQCGSGVPWALPWLPPPACLPPLWLLFPRLSAGLPAMPILPRASALCNFRLVSSVLAAANRVKVYLRCSHGEEGREGKIRLMKFTDFPPHGNWRPPYTTAKTCKNNQSQTHFFTFHVDVS